MIAKFKTFLFCFIVCSAFLSTYGQATKIDSLLSILKEKRGAVFLSNTHFELFDAYQNQNPDSALYHATRGLEIAKTTNSAEQRLKGYNLLSEYWLGKGNMDSALPVVQKALGINPTKNKALRVRALNNDARVSFMTSQYKDAVSQNLKALALANEIGDEKGTVVTNNNLGLNYLYLGDLDTSMNYFERALEVGKKTESRYLVALVLGNIGLIHEKKRENLKAMEAYKEALGLFRELDEKYYIAIGLLNVGIIYQKLNEYEKAREYFLESQAVNRIIGDDIGLFQLLMNMANLEVATGNLAKAKKKLDSALMLSKKINYKNGNADIYLAYANLYEEMENYELALKKRKLYEAWKDSIALKEHMAKIARLESRYEVEKKQNEILSLSEENIRKEAALLRKNKWINLLSVGGSLITLALILMFVIHKQRFKLSRQNAVFNAMTKTEVKEQRRIAADLHDSIGTMLASLKGQLSKLKVQDSENRQILQKTEFLLNKTVDETRRISHNMMPEAVAKFGLAIAIEGLLEDVESSHGIKTECIHNGLEQKMETTKELQIYRIVQELIHNVIKHTKSNTINVHLEKEGNLLNVMVKDDGKGFSSIPGGIVQGFGLKSIQSRINYLRGKLAIDSEPDKGTTVLFHIPIS